VKHWAGDVASWGESRYVKSGISFSLLSTPNTVETPSKKSYLLLLYVYTDKYVYVYMYTQIYYWHASRSTFTHVHVDMYACMHVCSMYIRELVIFFLSSPQGNPTWLQGTQGTGSDQSNATYQRHPIVDNSIIFGLACILGLTSTNK